MGPQPAFYEKYFFGLGPKKSPLSRRHTWDSSTDAEKYKIKGMKKCPAPSEEFLQAMKEELEGKGFAFSN